MALVTAAASDNNEARGGSREVASSLHSTSGAGRINRFYPHTRPLQLATRMSVTDLPSSGDVLTTGATAGEGIGRFKSPGTFDPAKEEWNLYQVRFEAALRVARVSDDTDKSSLLISSLSPEVFRRLYHSVLPRGIVEVPFKDLLAQLSDHYTPKTFKEFERLKLFSTRQEDQESVKDFVERLSTIVNRCDYDAETDTRGCSLLTAFIVGLRDERVRAKLVLEKNLSLDTAVRLAESCLAAEAESRMLDSDRPVNLLRSDEKEIDLRNVCDVVIQIIVQMAVVSARISVVVAVGGAT